MSIPKWNEIAGDERFKQASEQEQANIRNKWADDFLRLRDEGDFDLDDKQVSELLTKNGWQPGQVVTALSKRKQERAEQLKQEPDLILPDVRNLLMDKAAQKDGMPLLAGSIADDVELGFQRVAGTALKSLDFVTGGKIDGIHQSQKEHEAYMRWLDATSQTNTSAIEGWKEGGLGGFSKAVIHSTLRELPSFALQIGLGAVSGGLSTGFMGLSSAADKWADVVDDDTLSTRQKIGLIASHAYYEMVMEQLNTIPLARRLGNKASGAVFREMARNEGWKKAMGRLAWQFAKNATEEGLEEFATQMGQDLSDALIRNGEVTSDDIWTALRNSTEAFIGGAAMGGVGLGFEGASYLPIDAATSRNYFQQQLGTLPEKYASKAARQKALDDYELHGTPITVGEPTADDRAMAFAERLVAFDKMDEESRKQYEPYVKKWQDGLKQALEDRRNEPLPQPVNEKGETLGAVEIEDENKPEEPLPKPVDEEGNELRAEEVTEEEPPAEESEPTKEEAKPEPPAEEKPKEPPRWVAEHPNHEKSPGGHYEIVDANNILVSGDEGHLAIMQNRSEGAERTAQINDMSAHPNVSKMFTEGLTDEGAPIAVLRDGKLMVVSGNGRTKARRLMATRRTDMEYLNKLQQWAKDNGVEMPKGMQAPMLLRVIDENLNDEQLKDFVRQANMEGNDKLALDAAERSADDAVGMEKHGDKLIGLFTESEGDAIVSASNKEFVSKFRSLIGQRDGDVDSNGLPTSQFERRVANAFLGMLFKNMPVAERNDLLNNLINHGDKYNIVGVYRGLAKKAPKLIKLAQSNKAFALDDILPKALDALLDFKANREQFKNDPDMYLNQPMLGMDKRELKGDERDLFKILATAKYQSQMARVLQDYVDKAKQESTADLFGKTMNRGQLLKSVLAAEQARVESSGGAAVDAFLDNGSFDDEGMPTVEGARVAESKAAKKNPMSRSRAEKVFEPIYLDLTSNPVTDSYVGKIKQAVDDVAEKFGVKVVVHRNNDDLPADVQQDLVAFGGDDVAIQAWVDDSDNVVHVVASQMESPEMAVQKTLHEIVGHIGLAALFKGRNTDAWNDMVENLWEHHKNDIRERCKAYLADFDENTSEGRSELVEEWLARLAETNRKPMWWKSIVSKVRALLRACHVDVAYSDADIQQLLADAATAARRAQTMDDSNVRFSLVTDKKIEQEFNEEGKYIITYRSAMLGDDGKLYPPMATKGGEGMEKGKVYKSDEHPELRGKDGKFPLKSDMRDSKASGTVPAAYNPYFHSQAGMLNDQFAVAYDKSKMVTVKCRVLKSDIESGYQAEGAKDPVGYAEWATSGPVTRQMRKRGGRTVILSRYIMPVDIVEQKEVAKWIKDFIGDEDVTIPWNVVNQSLRDELEKIGVKVGSEAEFREAERIKNEKKKQRKPTGKTGNRYSIVGRKGAERLGIGGLQEAERMENNGESRESIWRNTGWWRGLDGEWRVELPNTKIDEDEWFKFRNRVFLDGDRISLDDWYKKNNFQWRSVADNGRQFDLARQWERNGGKNYPTLADILPEVTKNYPELADVSIRPYKPYAGNSFWIVQDDDGTLGGLSDDGKSLFIARRADQKVLFHEVQHLIQQIEGFARGANITEFENQTVDDKKVKSAALRFADTFRKWEKLGLDKNELARYTDEYFNNEMYYSDKTTKRVVGDRFGFSFDVTKSLYRSIRESLRMADWEADKFDEIVRDWRNELRSPFEKYQATSGEVEARAVEKRLEMSPEERAARPPWEDFDVAERDQIVLREDKKDKHIRYSVAKPAQDETSPIPQGPLPPIANIMRQRAARSPISNLRALRLPAMVMLGRELGGSLSVVDRIKRMPSALGVFREGSREIEAIRSLVEPHQLGNQWVVPQGQEDQQAEMIKDYWAERGIPRDEIEIVMKTDEAAKEVTIKAIWHDRSQTLLKKVLGHEIGHLIDYNQGETTSHGNVLGTVGGMGYKYLRKIIGETPDNQIDFEKFEKRKKELHKQAEGLAGEKPKDADELKAWRETVKAEYANLLTSECEQNGWFQAAVIREELVANTEWWSGEIGSDPNYRRYRTSPTELFAEAMSVLLNAPEKFAKQLPETWRMLQNYQKERPEFHKAWQGLMRMMNNEEAYTDALMKLAEEGFTADEETEIQIEKEHHDAWRAIKRKIVDSFADVNDASKQLVREGKVTLDETPISNIVSATHQSIKDYYLILAERLSKPLFNAGLTESDIGKYLEFQRIVNDPSINQGHIINPNGMTVNDAKDALAKLKRTLGKEKWELLGKWHKDFWQLRQETIIRLAEESGMYDKALIEHMKQNEWYSYRAVVDQIYNADGTEKRGMSKIYGLKGTLSPIANPLGWTYDHDMRLMGGILWNQARLKTIQFMKEQFPDLINKVKKFGVVSNHAPDGFTRLAVLENGQYVEYDVAETWAKGFQSQLDRDTAAILEKAQWITNLYRRAWTTLSPTFLLNNVVRDYLASYQNLSGINRQIGMVEWTKCWMQGMKEAFKFQFKGESELIEGMMKSNMFQSGGKGYDMSGRSGELAGSRRMELLRRYGMAEDEQIRRGAITRFTKYLSDHLGVTWLGDKLGKAVSATEMGAKAGGLLALQRNGEFTDAEKQWHVVRHIGSPDFAQRGTATPIWNTLFIFSNAAIQGWNGTLEMAKANPKGFAARFMATTGTAVFIQWALESGALLEAVKAVLPDDDEDKSKSVALLEWIQKMYGKITHHNRYNYMSLPIAEMDDGYCLAFRMPFAENSKLPAMMLHAALDQAYTQIKKDGNLWTETWRAALNQAPNFNPVLGLSGDAAIMYGCGWNGYDKYRQRHAVRAKDWEAGGWRRFKGTTAYMIHEYTPFAIVNNMFDLRDNPYWWWNLIGALGPGAWFKFQQYGEAEQSRAVTAEKRRERLNGKASAFYR